MTWRRITWRCTAGLVIVSALFGAPALLGITAHARQGGAAAGGEQNVALVAGPVAGPDGVRITGTIEHRGPGLPSVVRFRLDPPNAAGGGELLVSMYKGEGLFKRRVLRPQGPGVYELEYLFPEGGLWHFYVRFGPGQAGFVSGFRALITPAAGTVDTFGSVFRHDFARVPGFVQPLGYAVFGLIAALALAGVTSILIWLRRQPRRSPVTAQD